MTRQGLMYPPPALSAVLFVASAAYLAASFWIPEPSGQYVVVGPRVFPFVIGVGLMTCSVWLGLQTTPRGSTALDVSLNWSRLARCALLLLAYVALFEPAGFLVSTVTFLAAEAWVLGSRSWSRNLWASGLVTGALYGILVLLLGIPLP